VQPRFAQYGLRPIRTGRSLVGSLLFFLMNNIRHCHPTGSATHRQRSASYLADAVRSKRSRFITLFQARTKSWTNFPCASEPP
jgi:hypothetical protein